jgi:hypothetical protein
MNDHQQPECILIEQSKTAHDPSANLLKALAQSNDPELVNRALCALRRGPDTTATT